MGGDQEASPGCHYTRGCPGRKPRHPMKPIPSFPMKETENRIPAVDICGCPPCGRHYVQCFFNFNPCNGVLSLSHFTDEETSRKEGASETNPHPQQGTDEAAPQTVIFPKSSPRWAVEQAPVCGKHPWAAFVQDLRKSLRAQYCCFSLCFAWSVPFAVSEHKHWYQTSEDCELASGTQRG